LRSERLVAFRCHLPFPGTGCPEEDAILEEVRRECARVLELAGLRPEGVLLLVAPSDMLTGLVLYRWDARKVSAALFRIPGWGAAVVVTRGLLWHGPEVAKAVAAHEIGHLVREVSKPWTRHFAELLLRLGARLPGARRLRERLAYVRLREEVLADRIAALAGHAQGLEAALRLAMNEAGPNSHRALETRLRLLRARENRRRNA